MNAARLGTIALPGRGGVGGRDRPQSRYGQRVALGQGESGSLLSGQFAPGGLGRDVGRPQPPPRRVVDLGQHHGEVGRAHRVARVGIYIADKTHGCLVAPGAAEQQGNRVESDIDHDANA